LKRRQQEELRNRRRFDRERSLRSWGEWLGLEVTRQALLPLAALLVLAVGAGWWLGSRQVSRPLVVAPAVGTPN
jgi:anti-sigma-K factor RskA